MVFVIVYFLVKARTKKNGVPRGCAPLMQRGNPWNAVVPDFRPDAIARGNYEFR
ncbi:MAG: hypothetical protein H7Y60_02055 [Rhodospirillaceae bacterium]|nr:hypothetical protein [Rhodospirillales bacterium]